MTTLTHELPVTAEQVADIAGQVWESFLGLALEPAAVGGPAPEGVLTGLVGISGAWQGSVVVRCSGAHAVAAAETMFAAEPGSLDQSEVADALGELTNMVGGGIKGLLPEPSALSIPSVSGAQVFLPAARPVLEVGLRCGEQTVSVTVWQA